MNNLIIKSKENFQLKYLRHLINSKNFNEEFILEGIKAITAALSFIKIKKVFFTSSFLKTKRGKDLFSSLKLKTKNLFCLEENLMNFLSDTEHSQGILVIGESPRINNLNKLKGSFFLILDGINDPGNLGTLIRTACGSAVDGIILGGNSASPYSPKTLRAASGVFNIPILETKELILDINKLKAQGFKIICADTSALKFHYEVNYTFPLGLVLGSEAHGISGEILNLADLKVKIPLYNQVESLNVAVAGGILLYEIIKNITKS